MRRLLIFSTILFVLNGCRSEYGNVIELDGFEKEKLEYNQLPTSVQAVYEQFAKVELFNDTLVNNIQGLDIELYKPTLHSDQFGLIREGFNHIFVISGDYALKLKANKGDPFVFQDDSLFYTEELNQDESNYKYSSYVKIDLLEVLNDHK